MNEDDYAKFTLLCPAIKPGTHITSENNPDNNRVRLVYAPSFEDERGITCYRGFFQPMKDGGGYNGNSTHREIQQAAIRCSKREIRDVFCATCSRCAFMNAMKTRDGYAAGEVQPILANFSEA